MKKKNIKIFIVLILSLSLLRFSCNSYFKRPYDKGEVTKAYKNAVVFSEVSFVNSNSVQKISYIDYIYKGANSKELHFLMKVYFNERSASPQVKKDIKVIITPENPNIVLGGKKLAIFEASDDLLIFQVL